MIGDQYRRTVELLLDIAPGIFAEPLLGMKGGTAINLFLRDLPRLSVDIDLVYLDRDQPREQALKAIDDTLKRTADRLRRMPGVSLNLPTGKEERTMFVRRGRTVVKVEINPILRGTLYPTVAAKPTPATILEFRREVQINMMDPDELYGGKLVAAMDRQHPRDLFDVMHLMDIGGITPRMRRAFVVYVACHKRPIGELLTPNLKPIESEFRSAFEGMTTEAVTLEQLEAARERLFRELPASLDASERRFLLSLKAREPEWSLLDIPGVEMLPGIQWKLQNLKKMRPAKHQEQYELLRKKLAI